MNHRRIATAIVLAVAVISAGCGTSSPIEAAPSAPTTAAPTTAAPATSTTTTSQSASSELPSTTATSALSDAGPEPTSVALPYSESAIPSDVFIEHLAFGDHTVAVAWMEGAGQILWRVGDDIGDATSLESLFAQSAVDGEPIIVEISDVIAFDGRYFAFVMGDPRADDRSPTTLVSSDGQSWTRSPSSVVSGSPTSRPLTPDSPPYPSASAVADAIVDGDRIYATGWATIDETIRAAVWDSADGENWRLQTIEPLAYDNEFGSSIARSDIGTIVRIAGPTHTGVATLISTQRGEWAIAPVVDDSSYGQQIGANDGYFYNLIRHFDDGNVLRVYEPDIDEWQDIEVEFSPSTDETMMLHASSWHDPVVIISSIFTGRTTEPMRMWTFDRGDWESTHLDGDRLVAIDSCHIATVDQTTLYVFDRSHNGQC